MCISLHFYSCFADATVVQTLSIHSNIFKRHEGKRNFTFSNFIKDMFSCWHLGSYGNPENFFILVDCFSTLFYPVNLSVSWWIASSRCHPFRFQGAFCTPSACSEEAGDKVLNWTCFELDLQIRIYPNKAEKLVVTLGYKRHGAYKGSAYILWKWGLAEKKVRDWDGAPARAAIFLFYTHNQPVTHLD